MLLEARRNQRKRRRTSPLPAPSLMAPVASSPQASLPEHPSSGSPSAVTRHIPQGSRKSLLPALLLDARAKAALGAATPPLAAVVNSSGAQRAARPGSSSSAEHQRESDSEKITGNRWGTSSPLLTLGTAKAATPRDEHRGSEQGSCFFVPKPLPYLTPFYQKMSRWRPCSDAIARGRGLPLPRSLPSACTFGSRTRSGTC